LALELAAEQVGKAIEALERLQREQGKRVK
jgi:hypothetical protein